MYNYTFCQKAQNQNIIWKYNIKTETIKYFLEIMQRF